MKRETLIKTVGDNNDRAHYYLAATQEIIENLKFFTNISIIESIKQSEQSILGSAQISCHPIVAVEFLENLKSFHKYTKKIQKENQKYERINVETDLEFKISWILFKRELGKKLTGILEECLIEKKEF